MKKKKLKYKMSCFHVGFITSERKTKEERQQQLAMQIADELISKGFVIFHEIDGGLGCYKFATATVYALKLL